MTIPDHCKRFLLVMDILLLLCGVTMQLTSIVLLLRDPLKDIEDVGMSYKVKALLFVVGGITVITSFVGFRFWGKPRRRCAGSWYLFALLVGFVLQMGVIYCVVSATSMFADLSKEISAACGDDCESFASMARKETLAKAFQSFSSRFNTKHSCTISPNPTNYSECPDVTATCMKGWESVPIQMQKWCVPKAGYESHYKEECKTCLNRYYKSYIDGTEYLNKHPEMKDLWESPASLVWCRCYGRVLDSISRHQRLINFLVGTYVFLQVCLIFAVVYLIVFAPPKSEDDDDDALEMM